MGTCDATNNTCLCNSAAFVNSVTACFKNTCTDPADLQTAMAGAEALCAAAGVTLTPSATAAPTARYVVPAASRIPANRLLSVRPLARQPPLARPPGMYLRHNNRFTCLIYFLCSARPPPLPALQVRPKLPTLPSVLLVSLAWSVPSLPLLDSCSRSKARGQRCISWACILTYSWILGFSSLRLFWFLFVPSCIGFCRVIYHHDSSHIIEAPDQSRFQSTRSRGRDMVVRVLYFPYYCSNISGRAFQNSSLMISTCTTRTTVAGERFCFFFVAPLELGPEAVSPAGGVVSPTLVVLEISSVTWTSKLLGLLRVSGTGSIACKLSRSAGDR
jgi:hypothetical protein